jgi:hypothetical protein
MFSDRFVLAGSATVSLSSIVPTKSGFGLTPGK